jgi:hypothetical protein
MTASRGKSVRPATRRILVFGVAAISLPLALGAGIAMVTSDSSRHEAPQAAPMARLTPLVAEPLPRAPKSPGAAEKEVPDTTPERQPTDETEPAETPSPTPTPTPDASGGGGGGGNATPPSTGSTPPSTDSKLPSSGGGDD